MHGKPHKSELTQSCPKQSGGFENHNKENKSQENTDNMISFMCTYKGFRADKRYRILFRNRSRGDEHKIYIRR